MLTAGPDPREQRRRNTDRAWYIVAWQWCLAPVVEGWVGLSLVRFLCIYFAGLVGLSVKMSDEHIITGNALWLALAVIAAAFGEKVFVKLINRTSLSGQSQQRDSTDRRFERKEVEVTVHTQESDHTFAVADPARE